MALLKRNSKHIKNILSLRGIEQDALIGQGKFSLVYQDPTFEDVVVKISGDKLSHQFLQLSGKHFPDRLSVDYTAEETFGDRKLFIAVNRVRKLNDVRDFKDASRLARRIIKEVGLARSKYIFNSSLTDAEMNYMTLRDVSETAWEMPDSVRMALKSLASFALFRPHCGLDFHIGNFMATDDGTLVFSDPFQECVI